MVAGSRARGGLCLTLVAVLRSFVLALTLTFVGLLGTSVWAQGTPQGTAPDAGKSVDAADKLAGEHGSSVASGRSYEQHMDNGVKLFGEEHWEAAVAEFEAAYALSRRASPLINLALCYKKLRRYAEAIRMLERAVRFHRDSLQPRHQRAAELEIKQLRALLAYVHVDTMPKTAKLWVDGRPWLGENQALVLSPGPHEFKATANGYAAKTVRVRLISGRDNPLVKILLVATHGKIHIRAKQNSTWIRVDNKPVGRGTYRGSLVPGVHVIELTDGAETKRISIVVQAGHTAAVREDQDGGLLSADALPVGPPKAPEPTGIKLRSALRGVYLHGGVGLLALVNKPGLGFSSSGVQSGYSLDWRFGYRVNRWGAFELLGQFNHLRISGSYDRTGIGGDATLLTGRLGGGLRGMFPAKSTVRFVSMLGAGAAVQELEFRLPPVVDDLRFQNALGVSPFGVLELGAEVEVNRILVGLALQTTLQSSKHLTQADGRNIFAEAPLFFIGPSLRLGYAFW